MNDERIRKLIQAELAGEISAENEAELQQALAERPDLAEIYQEERGLSELFAADREAIVVPAGLSERISDRVLGSSPAARRFDFPRLGRALSVAAAILLVVGVSFWSGRRSTSAAPDRTRGGLIERRNELLQDLPAAEREELSQVFDRALERLGELDRSHEDQRGRILEELENEIGNRLGNPRER